MENWQPHSVAAPLESGQIQLWRVPLQRPPEAVGHLQRYLAPEELARAERFRFSRDRRRYVVARAVLRTLLGRALSLKAADVCLHYNEEGKPFLAASHESNLQFNVAHSHELALVALTRGPALGVDLEYRRKLENAQRIAQRFFSAQEVAALSAFPVSQQHAFFFRIWTRKEAFIKATGKGLSQPLGAFSVMDAGGRPLQHVQLEGVTTSWRIWDLSPGADYTAALVVWAESSPLSLHFYHA